MLTLTLKRNPILRPFRLFHGSLSSFSTSSCTRPYHPPTHPTTTTTTTLPPTAKKLPFTVSAHSRSWVDPYHWMSNTKDPDLVDYLNRENTYAEVFMADTQDLQRRLVDEMRARMPPGISTPPERWGPWLYYEYIPEGKEYPVLCRRLGRYEGFGRRVINYLRSFKKEQVLLNWNEIAEQFGYVHVGTCRVSPNHKFLAYTVDVNGDEMFTLHIKDLQTGDIIGNSEVQGVVSVAWAMDSSFLLYTACDQTLRPSRVLCKKMEIEGTDNTIFEERDTSYCVDITSTKDNKFITINSNSRSSSEIHVMNAADLQCRLHLVRKRVPGVQYFLEHHNGFFYILTNAPLENMQTDIHGYHLARCKVDEMALDDWQDVVLPSPDITFQDMDMFDGYLVLFVHQKGLPMLCSIDMPMSVGSKELVHVEDLDPWFFPFPSNICSIAPGSNNDFLTKTYRLVVSSLVMPDLIVDYDMSNKKFTIAHQEKVIGLTDISSSFQSDNPNESTSISTHADGNLQSPANSEDWDSLYKTFVCERKEAVSHDGTRIPLTIVYSSKAICDGQSPCLLHGYGSYGVVLDKSWCADRLCLLNRGWVIAFADVRGGGGDASWHCDGVRSNKLNSVHDFVACGNYLVGEGYAHKDGLCAVGSSAGGLLVGATLNMFPNLFRAVILKVPFLDICNTMLNSSLPLTILDYEEFGDPRNESEFELLYAYSPYDNLLAGACPPSMLVKASFSDSRVGVWEAAKWVAKARENSCCSCAKSIILRTNMTGGHFSDGGRYKQCEDTAFEYAFLMKMMGMLRD